MVQVNPTAQTYVDNVINTSTEFMYTSESTKIADSCLKSGGTFFSVSNPDFYCNDQCIRSYMRQVKQSTSITASVCSAFKKVFSFLPF